MIKGLDKFGANKIRSLAQIIQLKCRQNVYKSYINICESFAITNQKELYFLRCMKQSLQINDCIRLDKNKFKKFCRLFPEHKTNIEFLLYFRIPKLSYIEKELLFLEKEYGQISYHAEDNILCIDIGPFILKDVNFGKFTISIPLSNCGAPYEPYSLYVKAITPNRSRVDYHITHPHVSGENICLGEGKDSVYFALKEVRIIDVLEILKSILNTYGHDPYANILSWSQVYCNDCDVSIVDYSETRDCTKCSMVFCNSCVANCCEFTEPCCHNCYIKKFECSYCAKPLCSECTILCKKCKKTICDNESCDTCHHCIN